MKEAMKFFKLGIKVGLIVFAIDLAQAIIRTLIEMYQHRYDPPKGMMF